jgi:hypothetical protein
MDDAFLMRVLDGATNGDEYVQPLLRRQFIGVTKLRDRNPLTRPKMMPAIRAK